MTQTQTGWRTLAEPTYAVSRFGQAEQFPAGTVIRPLLGSVVGSEPFPDAIRVVVIEGSPFEYEIWWVTAESLRFVEADCGQCARRRSAHRLYWEPGDEEPWSWCDDCGGQCQFAGEEW